MPVVPGVGSVWQLPQPLVKSSLPGSCRRPARVADGVAARREPERREEREHEHGDRVPPASRVVWGASCPRGSESIPTRAAAPPELLQLLADDGRVRVVRRELQELLVRGDRGRRVADLLGRLRELELDVRVVRLQRDEPLVRVDRQRRLGLRVLERLRSPRVLALRVDGRADRVGEEPPGRTSPASDGKPCDGARNAARTARAAPRCCALGRPRQVERRRARGSASASFGLSVDRGVERGDRLGRVALGLERGRVVAPGLRVLRAAAPSPCARPRPTGPTSRREPRKMSPTPVPPAPTPNTTKPSPKTSARKTNIHLAWRRSRGKNIVSSIDGAVEPRGRAGATAACGFALFGRLFSNRAMRSSLAGSGPRRPRE